MNLTQISVLKSFIPAVSRTLVVSFTRAFNVHSPRGNIAVGRGQNYGHWTNIKSSLPTFIVVQSCSCNYYIQVRNAGHSKWANIKHTKMTNDQEKARETSKYCQLVRVAIKEKGSADPKVNKALADAIERAREAKIPIAPIMKVMEAAKSSKELKNVLLQVKGPGRSVFLIEVMSEHMVRCKGELGAIIKRNNGIWTDDSAMYQFKHKGIILCSAFEGKPLTQELLDISVAHAIEMEAEEVNFEAHPEFGDVFQFITEPVNFFKVKHGLVKFNYTIVDSDLHYIPTSPVELSDEELQAAKRLCDKLVVHTEVHKISDNIA